ncbi:uncharacterized protein G2W53_044552 [Senna tora]|uniref:Uncharacterized protein n=1 Tax=Senna tora TaxID=362788 RepID=A0A834SDK7_9FABA|nr:uncharacterized protein G2W53_044552 [Senna tora]
MCTDRGEEMRRENRFFLVNILRQHLVNCTFVPSSSRNSTGPPQQHIVQDDELLHDIPTGPSQQQGTTGSACVDSSTIIHQGRDPIDGNTCIQP